MKVGTLNLRWIGSIAKQKRIRNLIVKEGFDICFFLQETKRGVVSREVVARIWGSDDFD